MQNINALDPYRCSKNSVIGIDPGHPCRMLWAGGQHTLEIITRNIKYKYVYIFNIKM